MLAPERFPLHERPCRPGARVFPCPPARDALFNQAIEFAQRPSADPAEVLSSAPDVRIELPDERREAQAGHTCLPPQFVPHPSLRLGGHIEIQSVEPPAMRVPEEDECISPRIEHPRLLRMQGQPQSRHDALHPRQFAVGPMRGEQHEIVRIPDEAPTQFSALHMGPPGVAESRTSPARSPPRTAAPAVTSRLSGPRGRECWESPGGAPHHSASGCTLVVPVRGDTSLSSALHAAPPARAPVRPFQSPQRCDRPGRARRRWLLPADRRAPGCPVDTPCRRGRTHESAVRSWLAGTVPVAASGLIRGFLVLPQSLFRRCRGHVIE